jgi:membrane-associated protein
MLGIDVRGLVEAAGYIGITAIVFCESGVLLGFFLPGDSLLFTAGFLAGTGVLDLWVLVALCFVAAAAGDSVGYGIGKRYGRRLFNRPQSRFFRRDHLLSAEAFFEQHGGRAVVLARFLPWVRTFTPVAAGIGSMRYRRFLAVNLIGAALWGVGLPVAGALLGSTVPNADRYLLPAVLVVIAVSAMVSSRQLLRRARSPREEPPTP